MIMLIAMVVLFAIVSRWVVNQLVRRGPRASHPSHPPAVAKEAGRPAPKGPEDDPDFVRRLWG